MYCEENAMNVMKKVVMCKCILFSLQYHCFLSKIAFESKLFPSDTEKYPGSKIELLF